MRKTPFAGLTELAPAEPLSTDASSFQSRNPTLIDRFLELGAVSHRHDARPAMPNPDVAPSGSASTVGGALPADLTLFVGYTVNDGHGGETELSEQAVLTTDPAMEEPIGAPFAEIDYASGGDLSTAVYYYAVTLTDAAGGETPIGPYIDVERVPGEASARTLLSGMSTIAQAASADGWKLYRSKNGGEYHYLTSGTAAEDTYIDDGTDCLDCVPPPPINTTNRTNRLTVELPASGALPSGFTGINVYMSVDGSFRSPALFAAMPSASAGATFDVTGLALSEGTPPDVSTAVRGASQIDPDTEILDWHWKRPVASAAALPSGAEAGDVRVALDTGTAYVWASGASAWAPMGGAGGGVGGGGGSTLPMGSAFSWESTRDGSAAIRMVGREDITSDFLYESNSDIDIADYNAQAMDSSGGAMFNNGNSLAPGNAWAFASATQTFDDAIGDNFYAEAGFDPMTLDVEGAGVILGSAYTDIGPDGPQGLMAVYEPGAERFSIRSRAVVDDFALGNILASATAASGSIAASGCGISIQRYNDEITATIYSPEWSDAIFLDYTVPEEDRPFMRDRFQYQAGVYGRAASTGDIVVRYLHFDRTRLGRRLDIEIDDGTGIFMTTQTFSFNGKRGTPAGEGYRPDPLPGDGVTMIDSSSGGPLVYVEGTRAFMDATVFEASGAASAASGVLFSRLPGAYEPASINVVDDDGNVQRLRWQGDGTMIRETAGSGVIRISGMSVRHGPLQP